MVIAPLPWSVYPVRYAEKAPVNHVQIRDRNGDIVLVSSRYGEHAGAPLSEKAMLAIARRVVRAVNKEAK